MRKINCTRLFIYLGQSLVLLTFIDQALDTIALICDEALYDIPPSTPTTPTPIKTTTTGSVIGMCKADSRESLNITLDLSLSTLAMYEGNCTCSLSRVNKDGDVTMVFDIQIESCDSVTLNVDPWNYTAGCPGRHVFNSTNPVQPGEKIKIFMARINRENSASISGLITFTSRITDTIALICDEALYDIPPSTIPPPTPIKTTTPDIPVTQTIIGIAAGSVFGFVILILIIFLCIKKSKWRGCCRQKRDEQVPESERHPTYSGMMTTEKTVYEHINTNHLRPV